jgi:hypothetical protein
MAGVYNAAPGYMESIQLRIEKPSLLDFVIPTKEESHTLITQNNS